MHAKSFITSFFIDRRIRINKIQRGNALYITFTNGIILYGVLNSKITKNTNKYSEVVVILFIELQK